MAMSDHSESIIAAGEFMGQGTNANDLMKDHSSDKFQPSIFSLTLDEIQTKSGMSFGAMNMDELLNTVVSSDNFLVSSTVEQQAPPPQISVPTPLSGKTVEEIWSELLDNDGQPEQNQVGVDFSRPLSRNETLGEMTLEDFLIKAGVVKPPPPPAPQPPVNLNNNNPSVGGFFNNGGSCMNNNAGVNVGPTVMMGYDFSTHASCVNGGGMNNMMSNVNGGGMNNMMSDGSSVYNSPPNIVETGHNNNKRKQVPPVESSEAAEQRYKRMIKNRESAARSRARKQAYTSALEKELKHHKEENARLKFALEESERKFREESGEKESDKKASFGQLRRIKSASW